MILHRKAENLSPPVAARAANHQHTADYIKDPVGSSSRMEQNFPRFQLDNGRFRENIQKQIV